jgi:hypothetical protein
MRTTSSPNFPSSNAIWALDITKYYSEEILTRWEFHVIH